jgi:hypothetical protein
MDDHEYTKLMDMKTHEQITIIGTAPVSNTYITRVLNGWIYNQFNTQGNILGTTFVPDNS